MAELYRYTNDRDELLALWPHVDAAARYLETLRQSERTAAVRADHPERYIEEDPLVPIGIDLVSAAVPWLRRD